jgi:hypothetical protein
VWITIGQDQISGAEEKWEHIGRDFLTTSTSIEALGKHALRVTAMNCPFKGGGHLSNRNATSFVWRMIMCSNVA